MTIIENPLRDLKFASGNSTTPRWFHRRLPGYCETPLHEVAPFAERLGLGKVLVKDESHRLGLPSFKMLGASWATYRVLCERLGHEPANWTSIDKLAAEFASLRPLTLVTATDGNHGRAVARMAHLLGFACRIWVPANTAQSRIDAIRRDGAKVTVSDGGYDEAMQEAAAEASDRTLVVSDTSWPGYETVPAWVINGYSTMLEELDDQCASLGVSVPDAVVVPIGVGGLAAAVANYYRGIGSAQPFLIGVEPVDAACVLELARHGDIVTLDGEQNSIMAGLNCGTPSRIAWQTVSRSYDLLTTVTDDEVVEAMRHLARANIRSGECGAASLAALENIIAKKALPSLDNDAVVVLLSTEGVTDPELYELKVLNAL